MRGVALASPVCESELASHPCPAAPVPHARVVAVRDGENVARATTDAGGHFVLQLGAGGDVSRRAEVGGYADAGDRTVVIGDSRDVVVRLDVRTVIGG